MSDLIYEFLGISESPLAFYHLGMRGSKYFSELGAPRDRLFAGEGLQYIVLRGDYFKNRIVLCPCLGGRGWGCAMWGRMRTYTFLIYNIIYPFPQMYLHLFDLKYSRYIFTFKNKTPYILCASHTVALIKRKWKYIEYFLKNIDKWMKRSFYELKR